MKEKKVSNLKDASDILVSRHDIIDVPMGTHEGIITGADKRVHEGEEIYNYIDIMVELTDIKGITLKMGFPLNLSTASGLGKLLMSSGFDILGQKDYTLSDLRNIIVGRKIRFLTDKSDQGFSNILRDTVKFV